MAASAEERRHWQGVIKAYDGYMQYHLSANHARRMAFLALPKESRAAYEALGFREKLDAVDEGIRRNAEFIDEMIEDPVFAEMLSGGDSGGHSSHSHEHTNEHTTHDHSHDHSENHAGPSNPLAKKHERDTAQEKVRSTLRSFVRDWSEEGADEREKCYTPCLEALERAFPREGRDRGGVRVLVPGCGLGRLAMEIAAGGYESQGNEFSAYMLLGSHFVLNQTTTPRSHAIHPYLHSFSNHLTTNHLLRRVLIPDVCPSDVLGSGKGGDFSLVAGDFEEIYGPEHWGGPTSGDDTDGEPGSANQRGRWGAVVTCFFIDCARNILNYLRIIHTILEDDGVWINMGPLLWHFENSPTSSAKGEGSIELSLDEVKDLARAVGFEIHDERTIQTTYTGITEGMIRHEYQASGCLIGPFSMLTS